MSITHDGRKGAFGISAAEAAQVVLELVPGNGRPPPPDDLTKEEAALWTMYVNSMGPNYFTPETRPVLAELCKAVVNSGRVHEEIKRVRDSEFTDMDELAQVLKLAATT